ncbi:Charged multivesicular body protein 6 [Neolecta irregularis DAH-3]|uniref:Charged multivesicular body protein 6 n=1 Tax=Neolecta irregularis (strain DAH-3) TaxID=1198029 RepID=A0A1U7LJV0_NEOID|nr:Charged multivesicular body protein 6 [Neolecta irregularis DAH-3]|eukprot:OLL22919.1 Charged multivesicular body protein 6 [Neolecta irregularis DAH-3]
MGVTSSRRITSQDRAILDMKVQRDKVKMYQRKIQVVLDKERGWAKECLQKKDKDRALLALRRRKYQEQLLAKTDQQLATLEQLTSSIEFALVEKDVIYGLKQGNSVLKELHLEMSLEAVEKLMEDTAEAIAYQNEINEMLGTKITNAEEEEVLEELEEIQRQLAIAELPELPSVPDAKAPSKQEQDRSSMELARDLQTNDPITA